MIAVVVVSMALVAVTSFFYKSREGQLAKESGAAAERTATSAPPKQDDAGEPHIVHPPVTAVQHVVAGKPGTALTATSEQMKLENAGERDIVRDPVRGVQHLVTAKVKTAQTTNATKENDPVELWKLIRRGSVSAEVALANLYLEGEAVPQNCEQAHMLLQAASKKGSKAADNLLKSSYAERCE